MAAVLTFPAQPITELPDLPERGPDLLARHRGAVLDALRSQHDVLRDTYLAAEKPLRYTQPFAKHPLLTFRRTDMARRMRALRAALRDIER